MEKEIIFSKEVPAPIGPYSQAVRVANTYYFSGMIALDAQSGDMIGTDAASQTKKAMENIGALLAVKGLNYANIAKTSIFLKDMDDFSAVNQCYSSYFKDHFPARETVQVSRLPKDALVEITIIAVG
jgi:2-iminobutanoate/2-iminopropanoate deaminase